MPPSAAHCRRRFKRTASLGMAEVGHQASISRCHAGRGIRLDARYVLWLIIGGLLTLSAYITLIGFVTAHRTSLLLAHGALAQGAVRALTADEEKGGPRYRVDYGFTDPTPPDPIEAVQSGRAFVSEAQFRRLSVGGDVDVVFLPRRPDISMLEINLVVASRDPWKPLEVAAAAIGLVAMAGGFPFVWHYWRERRLLRWGRHTPATVTAVWTVNRGRYVITHARFEFQDSTGTTRQVWRATSVRSVRSN
jgi:hypothetical protein